MIIGRTLASVGVEGRTSLSKAYQLVERFSEDIDLLLLSDEGPATEELLDDLAAVVGGVCGSVATTGREGLLGHGDAPRVGRALGFARRMFCAYPELPNTPKAPGMRRQIVLEPGVRGGPRPSERRTIEPLMALALGKDAVYDDLAAFEIDVLHPARTMVEKLFAADCQPDRSFRPALTHMGFYAHGAIQPTVAKILDQRPASITFDSGTVETLRSGSPIDNRIADAIDASLTGGTRSEGQPFRVFVLSRSSEEGSVALGGPITNTTKAASGRTRAWTMGQRYTRLAA